VARALIITNPAAARTDHILVRTVADTLRAGGWSVELRATTGPGDARRFAADAVRDHLDVVAVFGGDGTTMQAAASLVGSGIPLGVIPGGTGNLLAGNLRMPPHPVRAARALLAARVSPLDLGRVERADGTHYFAVACGAGFDARVMAATTTHEKQRHRFAAYVATTLRLVPDIRSTPHIITVDGVVHQTTAAMVLVANCGEVIPPWVRLRSGVAHDDGLLDLIVIRADGLLDSVRAVWELLREGGAPAGTGPGFVGYARGRVVTVETEPGEPVQLDGEPHGMTPFTAEIVPHAIDVIIPPRP
jgi:YegS/Rv2252/BmrU family lipid kinase